MKHLKIDIVTFYIHNANALLTFLIFVPMCLCCFGFFRIPSYLFDLVLCASFFSEVIG